MKNNIEKSVPMNADSFAVEKESSALVSPMNEPAVDPKELAQAEKEAANSGNSYTHTFKKPVTYNNQLITEIVFNWERLNGEDGLAMEDELAAMNKMVVVPAFSGHYLIRMASRASSPVVGSDFFEKIHLSDYNKIRSKARSFLLASE